MKNRIVLAFTLLFVALTHAGCATYEYEYQEKYSGNVPPQARQAPPVKQNIKVGPLTLWNYNHHDPLENRWDLKAPKPAKDDRWTTRDFFGGETSYSKSSSGTTTPVVNPYDGSVHYETTGSMSESFNQRPGSWNHDGFYQNGGRQMKIMPTQPVRPPQPVWGLPQPCPQPQPAPRVEQCPTPQPAPQHQPAPRQQEQHEGPPPGVPWLLGPCPDSVSGRPAAGTNCAIVVRSTTPAQPYSYGH